MPQVKLFRTHEDAILPCQTDGDVGFDVFAVEKTEIPPHGRALISIGWRLAAEPIVSGSCIHGNLRSLLEVKARSGLALKEGIWPVGGIIDPIYRGSIGIIMHNSTVVTYRVKPGQKIAQLVWYPVVANWSEHGRHVSFEETDKIEETTRGDKGFGSSGT